MKRAFSCLILLLMALMLASCAKDPEASLQEEWLSESEPRPYGTVPISSEKTAYNYLTGEYTMAQDRVGKKPYAINVGNFQYSWPQAGISAADLILEIEAEGGITRLTCLFTDTREVPFIGTVRSLRDPYIEALYCIDPFYVSCGSSIIADQAVRDHGIVILDGDYLPDLVYWDQSRRDVGYPIEHCSFTSGKQIQDTVQSLALRDESLMTARSYFNFTSSGIVIPSSGDATNVHFLISQDKTYDGDFRYDSSTGTYLKWQHGDPHIDAGTPDSPTETQLAFTNVLVLFAKIQVIPDFMGLIDIDFQGGGSGYYFSGGKYEEITWIKGGYESTFQLTRVSDGKDLVLNTGKTWMGMARMENESTMQIS